MRRLAFVDVETTGLEPGVAEIIEVGIAFDDGREVHFKVKPEHIETAHPKALEVNGYRPEDWGDAISQHEAALRLAGELNDCFVGGQGTKFDVKFIDALGKKFGIDIKTRYAFDLVTLSYEHLMPLGLKSLSMGPVCEFIGIDPEPKIHRAINGARKAREVFGILLRAGPLKRFWWWLRNKFREQKPSRNE